MIEKTNIMIGPKMGAPSNAGNSNLESGTISWGRSLLDAIKFIRIIKYDNKKS